MQNLYGSSEGPAPHWAPAPGVISSIGSLRMAMCSSLVHWAQSPLLFWGNIGENTLFPDLGSSLPYANEGA